MSTATLKLLQIGVGSMGSRRLRHLSTRNDVELALFDARQDRRSSSIERFGITAFDTIELAMKWHPDGLIISSPPDAHNDYVKLALDRGLHHFSEANIWTPNFENILAVSSAKRLISASSCSLHFLGVIQELKRIVAEELGSLHSYQMSLSTYMPTWHPQEGLEYYARHRATSAGREMVPFELLWLNEVFGEPTRASGAVAKRGKLPGVQEDVWSLQLQLQNGATGQLIVTMGSMRTCREGLCIGTNGIVRFDVMTGEIRRQFTDAAPMESKTFGGTGNSEALERAYFDEINTFVDCIRGEGNWPLDYRSGAIATATLAACEASAKSNRAETVHPAIQPGILPS